MIRPLRSWHRRIVTVIVVLLPLAFIAGITARKIIPAMEQLRVAFVSPSAGFSHQIFEKDDLWPDLNIIARLYADTPPASSNGDTPFRLALELYPQVYLKIPDLLVYWVETQPLDSVRLPENAYLIGTLADREKRRYLLPLRASEGNGWVILYSLAQQRWVGAAKLPAHSGLIKGESR